MKQLLALCILTILISSCERVNKMKDQLLENDADSTQAMNEAQDIFEGTIIAEQQLMGAGGTFSSTIEYMISGDKISRRIKAGGITKFAKEEAGMIIDLKQDSVIIFQGNSMDKFYCKISIAQYREEMDRKVGAETASPGKAYESIFLPLDRPHAKGNNTRDTVTIKQMKCDLLDIVHENHHWEIQHCRQLNVKRNLVELLFFNIPLQAEGFPCIYKYELLAGRSGAVANTEDNAFDKLLKAVDKVIAAITESSIEIKEINTGKPEFFEKEIIENFTRVSSMSELEAKFPSGGGGGFDD